MSFSNPSNPIFVVDIPEIKTIRAKFVYNFYVQDESINEASGIPENFKTTSAEQITPSITGTSEFTSKVPRFAEISWTPVPTNSTNAANDLGYKLSFDDVTKKMVTEEDFTSSKFINYIFSDVDDFENAYKDINKDGVLDLGTSQATNIDNYVASILQNFLISNDDPNIKEKKQQIFDAVNSIERLADNPSKSLGISFLDKNGKQIIKTSGFEQLVSREDVNLRTQLNTLILPDLFTSVALPANVIRDLNKFYKLSVNKKQLNVSDATVRPIKIGNIVNDPSQIKSSFQFAGYLIERFEESNDGLTYTKNKVFYVDDPQKNILSDVFVKYGATYLYTIKTVVVIRTPAYNDSDNEVRLIDYLVGSKPKFIKFICKEDVAPPNPMNLSFIWDYKNSKLNICWAQPPNFQRDIKQYQIFRRKSVEEPFELLAQYCFDQSAKKFQTGELIDGNRLEMNPEEKSFVRYLQTPFKLFVDDEFIVDTEFYTSSKYIYAVASVDAHGLVSNYSAQFEVEFDFFKNKIMSKVISRAGAPRQYPNLYLKTDLFKDVIDVSGQASVRMKVYFMPEYYKLFYRDQKQIEKVVWTQKDNSYYKIQFINKQNQKSDSLKITIDDPHGLTATAAT
jgi:hypothetical protein